MTPEMNAARDKLAFLAGMSRAQVDAFYQYQDERRELLDALKAVVEMPMTYESIEQARAAIAKAEGRG